MVVKIFLKYVNPDTLEYDGKTLYHHDAYSDYIYYPNDKTDTTKLDKEIMDRCKVFNEHIPDKVILEEISEEYLSKLIDGIVKLDVNLEYEMYSEVYKYSFPLAIPKKIHKSEQFIAQLLDTISKSPIEIKALIAFVSFQLCMQFVLDNKHYKRISVMLAKILELIKENDLNSYWYYPACNIYASSKMNSYWGHKNNEILEVMLIFPKDKYLWHLILNIPTKKLFDHYQSTISVERYSKDNLYCLYNIYLNLINIYKNLLESLKIDSNYISNVKDKYIEMRESIDIYSQEYNDIQVYLYTTYYTDKILCFPDYIDFDSIHTIEYVESNLNRIRLEITNLLEILEETGVDSYIQKLHYNMFLKLVNVI